MFNKDIFKNIKVVKLISAILSLFAIGVIIILFLALNKEKTEKAALQNELAQVMKEKKSLSDQIAELELIKGDLEKKVSELGTKANMLSENYEKEKSQGDAIRSKLSKKEEELNGIKVKMETAMGEKKKLQEMLDEERTKYSQLKQRIDKLVDVKDVLEDKVRNIINKQGIELERIVVKAEGSLEGKVLVVNRDFNFIVVDIGSKDDIELSSVLTVFKKGKYVGEAQVEKVYDTMSAATIAKEVKPGSIAVGDSVVVRSDN